MPEEARSGPYVGRGVKLWLTKTHDDRAAAEQQLLNPNQRRGRSDGAIWGRCAPSHALIGGQFALQADFCPPKETPCRPMSLAATFA